MLSRGNGIDGASAPHRARARTCSTLVAARRGLEAHGFLLGCNGGRRDVYPSAMLQQTSQGRRAYVLSSPPGGSRLPAVDIFAPAPDLSLVATVDEQRASFERWIDGLPDEAPRK